MLQVQFLSQTGRVGGSRGSSAMRGFSGGFDWANYRLGLVSFFEGERNVTQLVQVLVLDAPRFGSLDGGRLWL